MKKFLKEGERIDDLQLLRRDGGPLQVIQNPNWFCFGMDAVLLANFATIKKQSAVIDLCTGCGVIPLILSAKTQAGRLAGVEIQQPVADMAARSVAMNHLDATIEIINADLKQLPQRNCFDAVTCNPPYKELNGGASSPNQTLAIARNELLCTLTDVIQAAVRLLKSNGKFFMVHRPERLTDILCSMRSHRLEPKRIRFVHPCEGRPPNLVLIEGMKGANPKLKYDAPLFVYNKDGTYTNEINKIYNN